MNPLTIRSYFNIFNIFRHECQQSPNPHYALWLKIEKDLKSLGTPTLPVSSVFLSGSDYVVLFGDEERGARMIDKLAFVFERGGDFLARHRSLERLPIIEP